MYILNKPCPVCKNPMVFLPENSPPRGGHKWNGKSYIVCPICRFKAFAKMKLEGYYMVIKEEYKK